VVRDRQHPLAAHYASVTSPVADGDPMPAFRDFYSAYQEQLLSRIRAGSTQTNNVRRSAALAPIDLSDAAQVRWLEAFVFPEAHDDLERLRAALAIPKTTRRMSSTATPSPASR
jgi:hypothetical protein